MTKQEIIEALAERMVVSKRQAGQFVDSFIELTQDSIRSGREINLRGFGVIRRQQRAARRGRNPRTGEMVDIPPKATVQFKPHKQLLDSLK